MCNPASFVVTKDCVFWSKKSDSHEEIIAEYGLHEGAGRINFVRVEVSPAGGNLDSDPATWVYGLDQDVLPDWYDEREIEGRTRIALVEWASAKLARSGEVKHINAGSVYAVGSATVEASGSATVGASGSATVQACDSATVRAFDSATVRAFDSATVRAFDSATVEASGSATVWAFDSATVFSQDGRRYTLVGPMAVQIDRSGDTVRVFTASS